MVESRALLLHQDLTLHVGVRDVAPPGLGSALVAVEWAGICGSDLHVLRTGDWVTSWPAVIGHEIAARVVECPGGELEPGTLVVVDSRVPCGTCRGCRRSGHLCERLGWVGEVCPGGLQQHAVFPVASLHACPAGIEPELAVLAEPLAVAVHAVGAVRRAGERALIVGYGPVGMLVHAELRRRWPRLPVDVVEPDLRRRGLAAAFGAGPAGMRADLPDEPYDLVVDAAGYPDALPDAVAWTARGGSIVLVAISHHPTRLAAADVVEKELTLTGSIGFETADLDAAIRRLHEAPAEYRPVITDAFDLGEAAASVAALAVTPAAGKAVVRP